MSTPKIQALGIMQEGSTTSWKATGYVEGVGWLEAWGTSPIDAGDALQVLAGLDPIDTLPRESPSAAALIQGFEWDSIEDHFELGPGVSICCASGTAVLELYESLCAERGDYEKPYCYDVFFLLHPTPEEPHLMDAGDPYSLVDRLSNVLAIVTGEPIARCRVIWSHDGFRSAYDTHLAYVLTRQQEFIQHSRFVEISDSTAGELAIAWKLSQSVWNQERARSRMVNALTYFYYAWHSPYIDQICLNLAITLESLFAPHSQSEATHQLAFNVSRFLHLDQKNREYTYQLVRKFYSVRSAIVHGGILDDEKIIDVTVEVFHMTAGILRGILLNEHLVQTFNEEPKRKELLRQYLFS